MTDSSRHNLLQGAAFALATSVVASTAAATVKWLSAELSPWLIVFSQYGLCTLLCLPWLLRRNVGWRTQRPLLHLVRGLAGWLGFTCYYLALPLIPLADASVLRAAAPIWIPLVVWLGLREALPRARWLALLLGLAGVMLIMQPGRHGLQPGHMLAVVAGIGLAISMATTRALSRSEPAGRVLFYYFLIAFLAATPMAISHAAAIPLRLLPGLAYVALSIFLTMVLYNRAYSLAPTTVVAPLGYVAVPLAVLLDWLLWGQPPQAGLLSGGLLIIISGVLAVTVGQRQRAEH